VDFSDGSSSSINAGDGLVFAAGAAYFLKPELAIQGTLGWKYQTIQQNTDGDAYLNRFPLEATVQYSPSNFRIGAGITYHLNPKLHASGVLAPAETSFDNALG
ncbi:MAG: hypothetical protein GWO08_02915, partial [Gammaproteobacteria bacterium]|nr:hypothetical protein [candidate division Zixibacteria bacterium]NIR92641.1 hypothetical protein [Gammaproteobacteria bacterium]NIS45869.1 hypothetical protein [candidate division Zixibacteria bacterium]NIU14006.1 hypothetical protein [candidate division Zixibacteria bacterium]NIV06041.1 hypothetical protein [candidate division Zixibacteria bacterium]